MRACVRGELQGRSADFIASFPFARNSRLLVRRDNGVKASVGAGEAVSHIRKLLDTIHDDMYERANKEYTARRRKVTEW